MGSFGAHILCFSCPGHNEFATAAGTSNIGAIPLQSSYKQRRGGFHGACSPSAARLIKPWRQLFPFTGEFFSNPPVEDCELRVQFAVD